MIVLILAKMSLQGTTLAKSQSYRDSAGVPRGVSNCSQSGYPGFSNPGVRGTQEVLAVRHPSRTLRVA